MNDTTKAASALGKKRWEGTTQKERSAHAKKMVTAREEKRKQARLAKEAEDALKTQDLGLHGVYSTVID